MVGQVRRQHCSLPCALIVAPLCQEIIQLSGCQKCVNEKMKSKRKQWINELAKHEHLIGCSQSLPLKWTVFSNCLQRQQLGLSIQRLSSFINSCVTENNPPTFVQSDGRQHFVFYMFLSVLVKQHMFVLWPWYQYGIEGELVSI